MIPYKIAYQVNKEINESVKYKRDIDLYQKPEHWTPAILEGDCEDYALAKRKKLLELGYPLKYIRLATCWTNFGEYHAVLIVTTDQGDFVLDNNHREPKTRQELMYKWDKIQQGSKWYKIS